MRNDDFHETFLAAVIGAFEELGGQKAMVAWAKQHPEKFYPLAIEAAKILEEARTLKVRSDKGLRKS